MAIRDWPADERPREKLLDKGPQALSDAELLAIFLRTGLPGQSAVDLARSLLGHFGNLRRLLEADHTTFCTARGMGTAKYTQLQAALELSRRHLLSTLQHGDALTSPDHTRRFLASHLRGRDREVFAVLFLDTRNRVLAFEELFQGTIDGASVHPRVVVSRALAHNAAALIVAHNHPSGVCEPSRADQQITDQIKRALALVDIRLLDHLIIGDGETRSLAEEGLL